MKNKFFSVVILSLLLNGCALSLQQKPINTVPANNDSPSVEEKSINNKLDLSGQNFKKVPDYVFGLTNLEDLDLSNNQLSGAVQAEIRHLQKLKALNLSDNLLTGVPAEVGQLQNLEILNLSNNQLTGLPYELGNLKNLKILDISGNEYSSIDLNIIKEKLPVEVNIIK